MISERETITCTGNRACAMKAVTFSLMVLFDVVLMPNKHGLCNGHYVPLGFLLQLEKSACGMP